jgi:SAM-dependent methyltransferase
METRPVPDDHPDRTRWNAKYASGFEPSYRPHPLAARALALDLPDGPVADLACGPSGAALLAAAAGRRVTAVDVSEIALRLLGEEAGRRGLSHLITLVHADLSAWAPEPRSYALVLCTRFWLAGIFTATANAVADGGVLAWEALTAEARRSRPDLPAEWCLAPGEPASLLAPAFTVIDQHDVPGHEVRQLLARGACLVPGPSLWTAGRGAGVYAGDGWWRCAHSAMSRRSMAAAIRSGKASGVQAKAVTPRPASAAAFSWS